LTAMKSVTMVRSALGSAHKSPRLIHSGMMKR
jgi:hypothetical protein